MRIGTWARMGLRVALGAPMACASGSAENVEPWIAPVPAPEVTQSAAPAPPPTPPAASAPPAASTPAASAPPSPASMERRLVRGVVTGPAGKPLPGAVVYFEDAPKEPGRGDKAFIDQRSMLFLPYVTAITVGGTVAFNNNDPFPHNVYTPDGEKFNLGLVSQGVRRTRTFNRPGVYRMLCNLHPAMLAYVVVVPSSYFAVTDGKGAFSIKDVPEGTYKLTAWASGAAQDTQQVKVSGADAVVNPSLHK